ncbi:MAG: M23 family metallopeptidase [Micrococcus sp.]|nr:M23 family metallopeptidase [Micrococcus sp.]
MRPGSEFGDGTVGIRAGKHLGLDFQPTVPGGEDWVHAVESGVVEALFTTIPAGSFYQPLYAGHTGNIVAIRTVSGRVWTFQHGKDFQVDLGDWVEAGDRLHRMWRSGRSSGNHLHMGLRINGRFVDPEPFLREHGIWPVANPYYSRSFSGTPAPTTAKDWFTMATKDELREVVGEFFTDVPFTSSNGKKNTTSLRTALGYLSTNQVRALVQNEALTLAVKGLADDEDVQTILDHIDARIAELNLDADGDPAAESEDEDQGHEEVA